MGKGRGSLRKLQKISNITSAVEWIESSVKCLTLGFQDRSSQIPQWDHWNYHCPNRRLGIGACALASHQSKMRLGVWMASNPNSKYSWSLPFCVLGRRSHHPWLLKPKNRGHSSLEYRSCPISDSWPSRKPLPCCHSTLQQCTQSLTAASGPGILEVTPEYHSLKLKISNFKRPL